MSDDTNAPSEVPTGRQWAYQQPKEILDLAWNLYYELSEGPPHGAPGAIDLSHMRIDHPVVSRLFDIAITAYREVTESVDDGIDAVLSVFARLAKEPTLTEDQRAAMNRQFIVALLRANGHVHEGESFLFCRPGCPKWKG